MNRARPRLTILLVTASCTLVLAACGSSGSKPKPAVNSQLERAECMRAHGVPNFPDPTQGPGGEGMSVDESPGGSLTIDGIPFGGPAFHAAQSTCKLFGGANGRPPISESQKLAMLAQAACVRRHGVPNFPDPTFPPGGGVASGAVGPGKDLRSPALLRAAKACANVGTSIPGGG